MKQTDIRIIRALSRLRTLSIKGTRREYEKNNILHDVTVMNNRIQTGQYMETDFIHRNQFDTGRRTEEFLRYMQGYITQSNKWSEILKPILKRNNIQTITDVCPGWAPKIELALTSLGYTGTVTIFDKNNHSTKQLQSMITSFKPLYTIMEKTGDVLSKSRKPQSNLTVCNHIIDDVMLSMYARSAGTPLDQIYLTEQLYIRATHEIVHREKMFDDFPDLFVERIDQFVPYNGIFIMMHYPGLTESSLRLKPWITFCHAMINNIHTKFLTTHYKQLDVRGVYQKTPDLFILQKLKR